MEEVTEESTLQPENISERTPFWQNSKLPIVVALIIVALTILASVRLVWNERKEKLTSPSTSTYFVCPDGSHHGPGVPSEGVQKWCKEHGYVRPVKQVAITTDKTEYEQGEEISASLSYSTSIYEWDGGAAWSIQRWEDGAWVTIQRRDDPYFHRTNTPECTEVGLEEIQECPPLKLFERKTWYEVKSMPKLVWEQSYKIQEKTFQCKTGKIERIETWPCVIFGLAASGKYRIRFEYAASIDPNDPFNRNIEIRYAEKEFTIKEK